MASNEMGECMKQLLTILTILFWTGSALAANPTNFVWTPSVSTDITGYRIYCGTATGVYTQNKDIGKPVLSPDGKMRYPVASFGLTGDGQKFCNITAYDGAANESAKDGEANFYWDKSAPAAPSTFGME